MAAGILGVSGSPVPDSNTDRLVRAVLDASGLESELVKLSEIDVRPCRACKRCVADNICRADDDFPELARKVRAAGALVVGGYSPYGSLDGFTKAFLERLWSLRHLTNLVRGKLAVIVVTGLTGRGRAEAAGAIARQMTMDGMETIGRLDMVGNVPCLTCGHGDDCPMSAVEALHGPGTPASDSLCVSAEDRSGVWAEAQRLGRLIGARLG